MNVREFFNKTDEVTHKIVDGVMGLEIPHVFIGLVIFIFLLVIKEKLEKKR